MTEKDINQKFSTIVRRGVFRSVARHISQDCEERLQEGICQAFELYREHAQRGVKLDIPVLVCICRRRATDLSRHLVKGQHSVKDPLDPRAFHQGRVELVHLDGLPEEDGELPGEGDPEVEAAAVEWGSTNPTGMVISAISLSEWLTKLPPDDLNLLTLRLQGFTLDEISSEVGRSITTVCHRLQYLGEDLASHARLPMPKRNRKPRSSPVLPHLAVA